MSRLSCIGYWFWPLASASIITTVFHLLGGAWLLVLHKPCRIALPDSDDFPFVDPERVLPENFAKESLNA